MYILWIILLLGIFYAIYFFLKRELFPRNITVNPKFEPFRVSVYFNFDVILKDFRLIEKVIPEFQKTWQESLNSKDRSYNLIRDGFCFTILNDSNKPLIYADSVQLFTTKIDFRFLIKEVKLSSLRRKSFKEDFNPAITIRQRGGALVFYITTPESDEKVRGVGSLGNDLIPFATFPYSALYYEGKAEQINADLKSEGWAEELYDTEYSLMTGDESSGYRHKYATIKLEYI